MKTTDHTHTAEENNEMVYPGTGLQNVEDNDENLNLGGEEDDPELNHDENDDLSLNIEDDTEVDE